MLTRASKLVAIILVLASLGGYYIIGAFGDAQKSGAKAKIHDIELGVNAYYLKHNQYPQSLEQLLVRDELGGPYLKNKDALYDP